ncbi:hypothetical protein C8R44DRAFT_882469 [Mycena epipterygia]|nr:hypothetical protein C8R44DRAFT_882469 [Mycena epipterygia]
MGKMDDSSITSTLPPELERKIFEIAFPRPKSVPDVMRVTWHVKNWVESLLYRTLVVRCTSRPADFFPCCSAEKFMENTSTEKMSYLRDSVRNPVIYLLSRKETHIVLSTCRSVGNLYVRATGYPTLQYVAAEVLQRTHLALPTSYNILVGPMILAMVKSLRALAILCPTHLYTHPPSSLSSRTTRAS